MSKYRSEITEIDGIKFHSKKEAEKYQSLKFMKMGGLVTDFSCQPKFKILDAFEKDGQKYRAIYYVADFDVTYPDGKREIIDIKPFDKRTGKFFLTPVFAIKQKMFDLKYPDLLLVIE